MHSFSFSGLIIQPLSCIRKGKPTQCNGKYREESRTMNFNHSTAAPWESCMQVRKQQLELDMEQQTGSSSGKEYIKVVHCHPAYLTYMQGTSWEHWAGWSTSWSQDCREKYQQPQIGRWHHPCGRKQIRTKEPLDESERGEWRSWFKIQHSED